MLSKIISGGQTGADRAALDAGIELQFPVGGFCPTGRKAEDGPISYGYPLIEIKGGYRQRTRKNVEESEGTAIFYKSILSGGTEQTMTFCINLKKPYKLIDIDLADIPAAAGIITEFIKTNGISRLNVAGPRQSNCPEIYTYVKQVIKTVIEESR
jgi:lysyl-tRNA synthetase class I